jgi:O-antigen/teichoic acid export membrane protein
MGSLLYVLLFAFAPFIGEWFELPELCSVIRVLGLQIIIGGINSVQVAYVHKNMLFKRYCLCSLLSVIIGATVAVSMAYMGFGVWALVAYNLIKLAASLVLIFLLFKCCFGFGFSKQRFVEMFPFASKMLLTKFVDQGYVEVTQVIISKYYSAADLAFYNKGKSFPDLLINNLNTALGSVMFPYFSQLQDDSERFKASLRSSVKMTSFVCIPILAGLMACSENFVMVVLTEKWLGIVPFLRLFCIYYVWIPFSNVVWQSLKAIGKGNVVLRLEIIKVVLNVTTLVAFLWILKSPIAVALSIVLTYTISFFVECYMAKLHMDYRIKEIFADFLPSFLISALMGIAVYAVGKLIISSTVVSLVIQIVVGVAFYVLAVILLRFPQVKAILSLVNKKKTK